MRRLKRSRRTEPDPMLIYVALQELRHARTLLRRAGAPKAADYAAAAVKSTDGALRHARRFA